MFQRSQLAPVEHVEMGALTRNRPILGLGPFDDPAADLARLDAQHFKAEQPSADDASAQDRVKGAVDRDIGLGGHAGGDIRR